MPDATRGTTRGPVRGGCIRDPRDPKDYSTRKPKVARFLRRNPEYSRTGCAKDGLVNVIQRDCTPVDDQGDNILACSAHATVGLLEYYIQKTTGKPVNLSRLFDFQQAKVLENSLDRDVGVSLKSALDVVRKVGALEAKEYWEYRPENVERPPKDDHLEKAARFKCASQFRLDDVNSLLRSGMIGVRNKLRRMLRAGYPCTFAFEMYSNLPGPETKDRPDVPFPPPGENSAENHSVLAVGYDNNRIIVEPVTKREFKGAIKFRNSWGKQWGEDGYGWIPYESILQSKAFDFWSITHDGFMDSPMFAAQQVVAPGQDPGLAGDHRG